MSKPTPGEALDAFLKELFRALHFPEIMDWINKKFFK